MMDLHRIKALRLHHRMKSFGSGDEVLDTLYDQALPHYENPDDAHDYVTFHHNWMQEAPKRAIAHFNEHLGKMVSRIPASAIRPGDCVYYPKHNTNYEVAHIDSEYAKHQGKVVIYVPNRETGKLWAWMLDNDSPHIAVSEIPKTNQPQEPK